MADFSKYFDNCLAVFQGGGCKAIAYIGAYEAALREGVIFNELAGTSAGSIIAALIAVGYTPNEIEKLVTNLELSRLVHKSKCAFFQIILGLLIFICSPAIGLITTFIKIDLYKYLYVCSFCKKFGLFSTSQLETFINDCLNEKIKKDGEPVLFEDLARNLHVVASDIQNRTYKVWDKLETPKESIARAICASCAFPVFFQPVDEKFVDGGLLSNSPSFIFANHLNYSKILSFRLKTNSENKGLKKYFESLIDTIVEGAVVIQNHLGIQVTEIPIEIEDVSALDFDKTFGQKSVKIIQKMIKQGKETTEDFFKKNSTNITPITPNGAHKILDTEEQMLTLISTFSQGTQIEEIYISCHNTRWVWLLFPTLLKWIQDGTLVYVYPLKYNKSFKNEDIKKEQEISRLRLLEELGCFCTEPETNKYVYGFICKVKEQWYGVLYDVKDGQYVTGKYYDHRVDSKGMKGWADKLKENQTISESQKKDRLQEVRLISCVPERIISILSKNKIYKNAQLEYKNINPNEVFFMTNQIRLAKYRQISTIFNLYKDCGMSFMEPAEIALLHSKTSILSPIVVEQYDNRWVVVEGKTRLFYAIHNQISSIKVLFVSNVKTELPIPLNAKLYAPNELMLSDEKSKKNLEYQDRFRHIEETLHPSAMYLID